MSSDGTSLVTVDLREAAEVQALIRRVRPTTLFHLAAMTSPRRNDLDPRGAEQVHRTVTRNLLDAIPQGTHVIFPSTDKVFDGSDPCPDEQSSPEPCCLYGRLKLECEQMIRDRAGRHHILRLPIVHGRGDRSSSSFVDAALADLQDGACVRAFSNVSRCYLKVEELVQWLAGLARDANYGTYHVGSPLFSYHDRIRNLAAEAGIAWEGRLVATSGDVTPAIQNLDTQKARRVLGAVFN
jgi:dTDP-4-dehydrorhamnose reductase